MMTEFIPIPTIVGAYQKARFGTQFSLFGPHVQSKWIHHPDRVEKVLEGRYEDVLPIMAEFVPSLDCCFRCPTCSYRKWKEDVGVWDERKMHPGFNMDRESMLLYIDRLKQGGLKALLFTGGGEPFYNPNTPESIAYAAKLGLRVGVYSNGGMLNEEKIERVFDAAPVFMRISLNAGSEESHAKIHGYDPAQGYFKKVLRNIGLVAKASASHGFKTDFGVSVIVNPTNVGELETIARTLVRIKEENGGGITYMNVRPTLDYDGGQQFPDEVFESAERTLEEKVRRITEAADMDLYNLTYKFKDVMSSREYKHCIASSFFAELGPDGNLYLCCEKVGNPEYAIGSLKEQTLEEVWQGKRRKEVIDSVNSGHCSSCPPSCKPHQLNKVFDQIDALRRLGRMDLVRDWIEDLKKVKLWDVDFL